ncbi:MAG: 16S rRNA (cytosine(1402)-N(4))-methyltransferase RsmH [bacterium]|nr:16S rRNA (cytosine(1402)-N(4))-methyltransferase RsmH [bacterium]
MTNHHVSVLLNEALAGLVISPNSWYLDATFGRGGHTAAILRAGGNVIAFDYDQEAIEYGQSTFATFIEQGRFALVRENFSKLSSIVPEVLKAHQISQLDGVLFDFGTSVDQLLSPDRGFSFDSDSPLDMRMDDRSSVRAKDLLNLLSEKQLVQIFQDYGGEREAKSIAKAIKIKFNREGLTSLQTTAQLAQLVSKTKHERGSKLHPATKVFQALRITVNMELENIELALPQALQLVAPTKNIVTIAFHEGEDRIVKRLFNQWESQDKGQKINNHIVVPTSSELEANPRARSARLRIFKKC